MCMRSQCILLLLFFPVREALFISAARIITPDRAASERGDLYRDVASFVPDTGTSPAVMNASMEHASLLNRYLYDQGSRLDGFQIMDTRVMGCYLAHLAVWEQIPPGETWLILEDDAVMLPGADTLLQAMQMRPYKYVNLAPTRTPPRRITSPHSGMLRECAVGDPGCYVLSTAAYLLTYEGALIARRHALPAEVCVDYYLSSLRDYTDPSFTYAFTENPLFGSNGRRSLIGHFCVHCQLPRTDQLLVLFLIILVVIVFTAGILVSLVYHRRRDTGYCDEKSM